MRLVPANLLAVFLRTAISAATGAAIFGTMFAYQNSLPLDFALRIIAFGVLPLALPAAIAVNLTLFLTLRPNRRLAAWIAGCLVGVVATLAFPIYMAAGTPAVNWREAMPIPAVTSLAALAIWIIASRRKGAVS